MKLEDNKNDSKKGGSLAAGRRALAILELVARRRGGYSFSELGTETKLSAASLTRLLKMLVDEDWLDHHTKDSPYAVGARLLQLADDLNVHAPGIDIAAPIVRDLATRTGHSACIATIRDDHFILLTKTERRDSYHFIDVMTPNRDWIDNAIGEILLAFQPAAVVSEIYRQHYQRDVSEADFARFEAIRDARSICRAEGHVTRMVVAVQPDETEPVRHVLALTALNAARPDPDALLLRVRDAGEEIETRLRRQGLKLGVSQ